MALRTQIAFSAGELTPELHERTNLDKYNTGLKTARNVNITKAGAIISRAGRAFYQKAKLSGRKIKVYSPPRSNLIFEWGHQYVKIWDFNGVIGPFELSHALTEADLPNIHFETNGGILYIFCSGKTPLVLYFASLPFIFITPSVYFNPTNFAPTSPTVTAGGTAPTGYDVDYAISVVVNEIESAPAIVNSGKRPLPQNPAEQNTISGVSSYFAAGATEMKVYRRPRNGGVFGYIGSTSSFSGTTAYFVDVGGDADYTHSPPMLSPPAQPDLLLPATGAIYQQRLLLTEIGDLAAIHASRTGKYSNFLREYPLSADSALKFKSGSSGYAIVLRMIDSDGLVVFTNAGIFLHTGALSTTNLGLQKKGNWIIDGRVPPIAMPGGVLFIDYSTNSVRSLQWSTEQASYSGEELSIYSSHLFLSKQVVSWSFQEGDIAMLWVVFDDGTYASFTYERDQQMKAWTRCDSAVNVEYVCSMGYPDQTIFVTEKNGDRYMEFTLPRHVPAITREIDTEYDKNPSVAAMDSMVSWRNYLNKNLVGADLFTIATTAVDGNGDPDWTKDLMLQCGTSGLFPSPGLGTVGTIMRYFDSDGSVIDLEVTFRHDDNKVLVTPTTTWPSTVTTKFNLYGVASTFTGLDHMEGESVGVIVDGGIVASPNNDVEEYDEIIVTGGAITLPNGMTGAMVHIGRPYVMDIETLDIDTVEQRPVLIESKIVNKLYIKIYKSRGLYVAEEFPAGNSVQGMEDIDQVEVDDTPDGGVIGNRYDPPTTRRVEATIQGDWKSQGRVCIRQVDPLHFEVLSIIPDLEDQRR